MNRPFTSSFLVESLESRTLLAATLPRGFHLSTFATGIDSPTAEVVAQDGRVFINEKGGNVRVVKNGQLLSTPLLTVSVDTFSERGLDGIALDPSFEQNGFVYVYYTRADGSNPNVRANNARNRVSRFTIDTNNPDVVQSGSEVVLLDNIPATEGNHDGGSMQFGADGMLYVGVGDAGDRPNAQNLGSLNGKVLRLNVHNPSNVIPADNPFVGQNGTRPEIWAYGFRNPFTSAALPGTNTIYINDVGSSGDPVTEEVNQLVKGGNFGWATGEGPLNKRGLVDPIYSYAHPNQKGAITGGVFYSGTQFPAAFHNQYLVSDYIMGFIREPNATTHTATDFATGLDLPVDLDVAPDGSLLVLSLTGTVFRISYKDRTAPTASLTKAPVLTTAGESTYTFSVTYRDDVGVAASNFDDNDLRVTGPHGFRASAVLIGTARSRTPGARIAIYQVRAPGGLFDASDDGSYTVTLRANEVSDLRGNLAAKKKLGVFTAQV